MFQTISISLHWSQKTLAFLSFHIHHMAMPGKASQMVLMMGFLKALGHHSLMVWEGWPQILLLRLNFIAPLSQIAVAKGKLSSK